MRIRVIGQCTIEIGGREVTPNASHLFGLLLRLGGEAGRLVTRRELTDLLFPDATKDKSAAHNLRQLLYQAKGKGAPIEAVSDAIRVAHPVLLDVDEFLNGSSPDFPNELRTLAVLPRYFPDFSGSFTRWLESFRERQEARIRHSLLGAIELLRQRADWRSVELRALECLALDPLNEPATLARAEALARSGSKDRALTLLDAYRSEMDHRDPSIGLPATVLRRRMSGIESQTSPTAPTTALVGRGDEFSQLCGCWRKSKGGQFEVTLIRGEPGSGKSRILEEYEALVTMTGGSHLAVVRRATDERFRPFALFASLIPVLLRCPGAAGRDPDLCPFLDRLTQADPPALDGIGTPEEALYINAAITRAVVDLVKAICTEGPLVILLDNVVSLDAASTNALVELAASAQTAPVHMVIVCSSNHARTLLAPMATTTISLSPLSRDDSFDLVDRATASASRPVSAREREWCVSVGAGNPAHLVLLAAHCLSPRIALDVPYDVVSAVDRRLRSLSADAARVLEACAVLCDHCDAILLADVLDIPPFALLTCLHELEDGGLIASNGEAVNLRSALVLERVLRLASRSVLTVLHTRCAQSLEKRPRSAHSHWRIANHWRSAGQHQLARATVSASWRASLQLGHPSQAEASIREYLGLTTSPRERIALYDDLIEVTQVAGNAAATVAAIDERAAVMRSVGELDTRAESLAFDRLDAKLFDYEDPSTSERDLVCFMQSPTLDVPRRLRAALRLMLNSDATANPGLASRVYSALQDLRVDDPHATAHLRQCVLVYHSVFGDKAEALAIAGQIIDDAKKDPRSWPHIRGKLNASLALQLAGKASDALSHLEECYAQVVPLGIASITIQVASRLASFILDDGDLAGAASWAARACAHADEGSHGRLPSDYLSVQTDLALLRGDVSSARHLIATMRDATPLYNAPRYKMGLLAYSMRLSQFEGSKVDTQSVKTLLDWHYRARAFGRHDDEMDALWVALSGGRRAALAHQLLTEYLTQYRRETRTCRFMLRMRSSADSAWNCQPS